VKVAFHSEVVSGAEAVRAEAWRVFLCRPASRAAGYSWAGGLERRVK